MAEGTDAEARQYSLVVYLAVATWLAVAVPTDQLVSNYFAVAEYSAWAPAVLAGLLTATFSSALASLVGAPRILHALATDRVTPAASWLSHRDRRGEPRNALLLTIGVVAAAVVLRDLNAIAPLITMVFLVTYLAINVAVLAELVVDLPSYRPTFRVPWPVPLAGAVGCLGAMIVIDPWLSVLALAAVGGVLFWLGRRTLERPVTDIRSAMLLALGLWATRTAKGIISSEERIWSPRFLVPVSGHDDIERARRWLPELVEDSGPVRLVAVSPGEVDDDLRAGTQHLREDLEDAGIDTSVPEGGIAQAEQGPVAALLVARDQADPEAANVVVAGFPDTPEHDAATRSLLRNAFDADAGVVLVPPRPPRDTSSPEIALWVRAQGPSWHLEGHLPHSDLALLVAYRLARSWDARLTLTTAVAREEDTEPAERYLDEVAERARLPGPPGVHVIQRPFADALELAPPANLHVFALSSQVDFGWLREVRERLAIPCLFVRDSGVENAFA